MAATGAYVLLNFGTTVYAYLSWSLSNAKTNAFDNVVRLRPRWHWTALSRSRRRQAYAHILEVLIPQHFCSFMAQGVWICVARYCTPHCDGPTVFTYHMATSSVLLSAIVFLLTAGFLGKDGLQRNPVRHVQVGAALMVAVFTTHQYLATQSIFLEIVAGLDVTIHEAMENPETLRPAGNGQILMDGKYWARATIVVLAIGLCLKVMLELYLPETWVATATGSCPGWPSDCGLHIPVLGDDTGAGTTGRVAGAQGPASRRQRLTVLATRYAFVSSAVVEEACSSFFVRVMIVLFSMLLWSTQLVLYPFIPGVAPNDHREPAISKAMSLGQISALVFLLDPLLVILNSAIGNTYRHPPNGLIPLSARTGAWRTRNVPNDSSVELRSWPDAGRPGPEHPRGAPLPRPAPCRIDSRSTSPIPAPDEIRAGKSAYEACLRDHFAATVIISWVAAVVVLAVALAAPILLAAFLNGNAQLGRDGRTVDDMLDEEQWRSIMLAYFVFSTTGLGLFLLRTILGLWATWRRRMRALGRSRG